MLSFTTEYGSLKTKVKSPGKPGNKEDKDIKANFCTFITKDVNLAKEFAFDVNEDFKKLKTRHTFIITDLVVDEKDKSDPALARINAKRKGKIERLLDIDGKLSKKEINFSA
mgnify:CR=1 FL=1